MNGPESKSENRVESFVFYRSFLEALAEMSEGEKLETVLAVCTYGLDGTEPELKSPMSRAVFRLARPQIDANREKRKNGSRGGRPKKKTSGFDKENHRFAEEKPNVNANKNENANENGNANGAGASRQKAGKQPFVPPTVEEVAAYVQQRGSTVDPQGFIDFYEAKGWMIGKTPMKDWKAACRNAESWERWTTKAGQREQARTARDYEGGESFV